MLVDTKQRIVDTAIAIFNDDQSASLERVAEKASVTRRTLHRYFKDRRELLAACSKDIRKRCSEAITAALDNPGDPAWQLEQLLYAAIDCGVKYAFFHKLHHSEDHDHRSANDDCAAYEAMHRRFLQFIVHLQEQAIITKHLTAEWIYCFFSGVVNTAVSADSTGAVARLSQKQFAWFSFSKGIGI
ncbi:TetR/AcrR family transcriptional regulator [Parapedobacter sp. ISTM3]|uniref:Transcriptional regulator, TetR family n=1 Tax=Parapedobacter luteus TaxID=623280 RepID=A0A1T4ZYE5_9SPHI|nr:MULTISPECIES: helix-turn-helix domain-containing protein [Parapedobacter]MBK1438781.1 TetR/AcrR family transcriptional regulator [Parapedobacter sp. ISTM3]SKB27615.1 transcriptional regulator, TetR family [Parapedobacter luteus]